MAIPRPLRMSYADAMRLATNLQDKSSTAKSADVKGGLQRSPWGQKRRSSDQAEARFQAQVGAYATLKGWWWFHVTNPRTQTAGLPDLVLLRERVVWIELKATSLLTGRTGKLRPAQERVIDMLQAAGQEVHVFTDSSDDWLAIQGVLA